MHSRLLEIIQHKQTEVAALKAKLAEQPHHPIAQILKGKHLIHSRRDFGAALQSERLSIIAEIKRRSPSRGDLADITDPVALAAIYQKSGASAISVLTDTRFFQGSLSDLSLVSSAINGTNCPILRKDFILDPVQIAEAAHAGADAVLLIVVVLQERIGDLLQTARELHLPALVEVHNEAELDLALDNGATIIGVNNRDLNTFEVDLETSFRLIEHIPADRVRVAESGVKSPLNAWELRAAGYDAVLIGEALVTADDPAQFIQEIREAM